MKKVCFLTNNWNQLGGIERVISVLSIGFSKKENIQLTLLSLHSQAGKNSFFQLSEGTKCIHANCPLNEKPDNYLVKFFSENVFDDLVTFHAGTALIVSRIINKIKPIKWIATEHCDPLNYTWKRRLLNLYAYSKADFLVVLTDQTAEYYRKRLLRKITVIPNPVSFTCAESCHYSSKTILAVGRIEMVKRFDLLVKAFNSLTEKYPDWKLRIIGSGSQFEQLKQEADKSANIELLGSRDDIKELMLDASFLVISSQYEGFSLVAIEALECGLPIVSTPLPSIRAITQGYNTVKFAASNDWKSLAGKMEELICNPSLIQKMGIDAKACAKRYSLNNILHRWEEIL